MFLFSFVLGTVKPITLEDATAVSLVATHAACSLFGENNPSLLVANEMGAGIRDVGENGPTDHIMLTINTINPCHVSFGIKVESSTGSKTRCIVRFNEALVENFRPHGWWDLAEGGGHQDSCNQYSYHDYY